MELEIASEIVKGGKRIIGFDLIPNIKDEEEFCQNLFYGHSYLSDEEERIVIESSKYGIDWNKHSFDVNKKERKALKSILGNKRNYTIEITENSIIKLRINEDGKMNRYPGSKRARENRKKLKKAKKNRKHGK